MKKKNIVKKISPIINIVNTIVLTISMLIITILFMDSIINKYNFFIILTIFYIVIYLSTSINTIIHELGHLIFGLLTKYKFSSFRIGFIILIKENNKFKIKKQNVAGTAGQCLMIPPELNNNTIPYKLYNIGGVLLNLIFSLIITLIIILVKPSNEILTFTLNTIIVFGIYFALNNGIPRESNLVTNDGANIILLSKDKNAIKAFYTQLKILEAQSKNIRIKDMPKEWFEINTNETTNQMINTIKVLKCNKLLDEHKFEKLKEEIDELLNNYSIINLHKNLLIIDKIYCELYLKNFDIAEKLMTKDIKKFMNLMKTNPSIIRTEYAYTLLKEKNSINAQKILKRFKKAIKTHPYECEIESEKELIELIEKNI